MVISEPKYQLIGLYGGTFNPVHNGHLSAAKEILDITGMMRMLLIPSATPPHRATPNVSAQDRFNMLSLAVERSGELYADDCELQREGKSYTFDTIVGFAKQLPKYQAICFVMGQDAFAQFYRWHRWDEFLQYCHLVVAQRPGYQRDLAPELHELKPAIASSSEELKAQRQGKILFVDQTPLDISSTQIRHDIAQGELNQLLLPDSVHNYIERHHLYTVE